MFEITLIIVFTIIDAYKDGLAGRGQAPWWEWHIAKWIGFFGSQGYLVYRYLSDHQWASEYYWDIVFTAILCKVLWNFVYKFTVDEQKGELP